MTVRRFPSFSRVAIYGAGATILRTSDSLIQLYLPGIGNGIPLTNVLTLSQSGLRSSKYHHRYYVRLL